MDYKIANDLRGNTMIEKRKAKYFMYDDKHHDLYFVWEDGSKVSFIQNDFTVKTIDIFTGEEYETATCILTMDEPNVRYEIPNEKISFIVFNVIRADR